MARRKSSNKTSPDDATPKPDAEPVSDAEQSAETDETAEVSDGAQPSASGDKEHDAVDADAKSAASGEAAEALEDTNGWESAADGEHEIVSEPEVPAKDPPQPAEQPAPVAPAPARRSAWLLVFGGVVAALLGFIAARSEMLNRDTTLTTQLDAVTDRLTSLEANIADLTGRQVLETSDLSPIEANLTTLSERIDELSEQVETLKARPTVTSEVPQELLNAALADLRATADAQQDEIDRLLADARLIKDDAEAAANATLARAAVTRIQSAVDTGAPFAAALADLEAAGETDIPDALRNSADTGVVPLADLQAAIPDMARLALDAARSSETSSGVTGFLQQQLGVRSVEPRAGSDPDAVLSRIEAAARSGRLGDALAEAETLPPPAQDALRSWTDQVEARLGAVSAANALAERLSAL